MLKYYPLYSVSCDSIFSAWTSETKLSFPYLSSPFRRLLQTFYALPVHPLPTSFIFRCTTRVRGAFYRHYRTIYSFKKRGINYRFFFFFRDFIKIFWKVTHFFRTLLEESMLTHTSLESVNILLNKIFIRYMGYLLDQQF